MPAVYPGNSDSPTLTIYCKSVIIHRQTDNIKVIVYAMLCRWLNKHKAFKRPNKVTRKLEVEFYSMHSFNMTNLFFFNYEGRCWQKNWPHFNYLKCWQGAACKTNQISNLQRKEKSLTCFWGAGYLPKLSKHGHIQTTTDDSVHILVSQQNWRSLKNTKKKCK